MITNIDYIWGKEYDIQEHDKLAVLTYILCKLLICLNQLNFYFPCLHQNFKVWQEYTQTTIDIISGPRIFEIAVKLSASQHPLKYDYTKKSTSRYKLDSHSDTIRSRITLYLFYYGKAM